MAFIWVCDKGNGVNHLGFQMGCKTVILDAFNRRLWLNTAIRSRFLIYYGIIGDILVIKNSALTKAIQFSVLSTKQERKLLYRTSLFLSYLEGFFVCLYCGFVGVLYIQAVSRNVWVKTPLTLGKSPCVQCPVTTVELCAPSAVGRQTKGCVCSCVEFADSLGGKCWFLPAHTNFQSL